MVQQFHKKNFKLSISKNVSDSIYLSCLYKTKSSWALFSSFLVKYFNKLSHLVHRLNYLMSFFVDFLENYFLWELASLST